MIACDVTNVGTRNIFNNLRIAVLENRVAKNSGHRVARENIFCTDVLNICGPVVWNRLHMNFLAPRILRWFLDFLNILRNPALNAIRIIEPEREMREMCLGRMERTKKS